MKGKNSKIAIFFITFLFSVNLVSFLTIFLTVDSPTTYESQSKSYLNLNESSDPLTLKVGKFYTPYTLDPVDSWDEDSYNIIEQVVETLFTYDLYDPELPLINQLAESYTWINPTELYITLRQGILFHDGTPFNAAAAKWNLDRLLYLTDCTGNNSGQVSISSSLWFFSDGLTPIISSVSTSGEWDVIITLNAPYGPLLHLLTFINAGMLSPTSTPATEFIDLHTGNLVGTGPFQFDYYDSDIEVKYSRWDDYWKEPAYFEEISLRIFNNQTTANNAMLAHEIDMLIQVSDEYLPLYEADPKITLKKFSEDTGIPGILYYYIGFNNHKYNQTWRKAMSFAIDYTYILDELLLGNAIRANSPISPIFGAAYNESATAANFDINNARSIMQSMGFGVGFTTDQEWIAVAESSDPFLTVPYTYNLENKLREDLGIILLEYFKLIGIHVELEAVTWSDFLEYLFFDNDHLGTFFVGRTADFLDPYNMLAPLFNPNTFDNIAQVDDPILNVLLDLALGTTDETTRFNIYKNIQSYFAEQGYFHAPIYHNMVYFVHLTELQGVPYNARERFYAYPIHWATPGAFTLTSDAETPDDGDFTLSWTIAEGANNYSVYQDSSFIDEFHSGLTLVAEDITDLSLHLSGYPDGIYYFIVVAHDENGDTLSNCIQVEVELKLPPTIIYDTVPEETTLTYTRTSQIIGSVGAYSTSRIVHVGWVGPIDSGFTLETTYTEEETTGIYLSDTNVMTTNQLEPGEHTLTLRFYNTDEMYYDKKFTVTVYRQAKLNLRGEFDYLLRERVKISIVALALDTEDQFLLDPITIKGMTVHIKISDYDGNLKVEDTMSYDPDGFFHWESVDTIKKLHNIFTKGIYIVQAWIEFPSESYYMGGIDVIEFHIDPPSEEEVDPWFIIGMVGFAGLIGVNVALAILIKRKHRIG